MSKDETIANGRWEFDGKVTAVFSNMLERSIPQYDVMRKGVFDLACKYRQEGTVILDLGCSNGEAIADLVKKFGAHNKFIGVEVSEPMRRAFKHRFSGYISSKTVEVMDLDLRGEFPQVRPSVCLSILTLQFIPIEYRQAVVDQVYHALLPGGAFIVVEKILGNSSQLDTDFVNIYYDLKRNHQYTEDQIKAKRKSLEGALVPITSKWNEDMLRNAGFATVDAFWRWMNFAGWIAIKK